MLRYVKWQMASTLARARRAICKVQITFENSKLNVPSVKSQYVGTFYADIQGILHFECQHSATPSLCNLFEFSCKNF